jgi:5-methylcytosine-specific restriction endonuclease McrA
MKPRPGYEPVELEKRKAWPKATVAAVWMACDGKCVDCGSKEALDIDHALPLALGGSNDQSNLVLRCREVCHKLKTKSDVERIAKAKRVGAKDRGERTQKFVRKINSRGFEKGVKQKIPSRPWPK